MTTEIFKGKEWVEVDEGCYRKHYYQMKFVLKLNGLSGVKYFIEKKPEPLNKEWDKIAEIINERCSEEVSELILDDLAQILDKKEKPKGLTKGELEITRLAVSLFGETTPEKEIIIKKLYSEIERLKK